MKELSTNRRLEYWNDLQKSVGLPDEKVYGPFNKNLAYETAKNNNEVTFILNKCRDYNWFVYSYIKDMLKQGYDYQCLEQRHFSGQDPERLIPEDSFST